MSDPTTHAQTKRKSWLPLCIGLGLCFGTALGVVLDVALDAGPRGVLIGLGPAFGLIAGVIGGRYLDKRDGIDSEQ